MRGWRNRQTRWIQVPVPARAWGFNSPLAHHEIPMERVSASDGSHGGARFSLCRRVWAIPQLGRRTTTPAREVSHAPGPLVCRRGRWSLAPPEGGDVRRFPAGHGCVGLEAAVGGAGVRDAVARGAGAAGGPAAQTLISGRVEEGVGAVARLAGEVQPGGEHRTAGRLRLHVEVPGAAGVEARHDRAQRVRAGGVRELVAPLGVSAHVVGAGVVGLPEVEQGAGQRDAVAAEDMAVDGRPGCRGAGRHQGGAQW